MRSDLWNAASMRRSRGGFTRPGALVACVLAWLIATAAVAAQGDGRARARKVRTIPFATAVAAPLSSRLLPDDEIVEIAALEDPDVLEIDETPRQLFAALVRRRTNVLVVDVTAVSGVLVHGGTEIVTRFVGHVAEVLSSDPDDPEVGTLAATRPIEFTTAGGEAAIRSVVVRTAGRVDYPYPARYVVIVGQRYPEVGRVVSWSPPLLVRGASVAPVAPDGSLLKGLTLEEMRVIAARAR